MSTYAARIRAARAYAGLTQEQLAAELDVDTQTIKRREAGSHDPKRGERMAIAAICGVPPEFMEHGFGAERDEIAARLDRIEAVLTGDGLESVRGYVRQVIHEIDAEAGPDDGAASPTPRPAGGQGTQASPRPRAQSRRRS